jgi:MFS family permease
MVFVYRTVFVSSSLHISIRAAYRSGEPKNFREAWIALVGLSAVFLFEMLDNSILNVALPTIGHDLHASPTSLQWVTGSYSVVFGGLMLAFGAIADRFGRRRVMLVGLVLLGVASLATAFVTTSGEVIAVRGLMGVAAAMTTPGSIALAFRLFTRDGLRVRAMTLISTVGRSSSLSSPPRSSSRMASKPGPPGLRAAVRSSVESSS